MDHQGYWAIAEADIEIQNPVTDRKLRLLDDYCDIRDGLRVLDIGCGKAWVMRQWAERLTIEGTGLDINPAFLEVARRKPPARGRLQFIEAPAEQFSPTPASYDVVLCLGASFALGGFVQAVDWMTSAAKPGGAVVIGDLTLKHRPVVNAHQHLPLDPVDLVATVQRHGAEVSALISASDADFERYVSHHRHATLRWPASIQSIVTTTTCSKRAAAIGTTTSRRSAHTWAGSSLSAARRTDYSAIRRKNRLTPTAKDGQWRCTMASS